MKDILVTGACGNIGTHVVDLLVERGFSVRALDLDTPENRAWVARWGSAVRNCLGNLDDEAALGSAVKGVCQVIHLAEVPPPLTDMDQFAGYRVNVGGTRSLLDACRAEPRPPRFIFCSSVAVFGNNAAATGPRKADEPIFPSDSYGRQKAEAESLVKAAGLDYAIFRLGIFPPIDLAALSPFVFEFHPDMRVEFAHPRDVALGLVNALDVAAVNGRIMLLGGGSKNRYLYRDWLNLALQSMSIEALPRSAFGEVRYLSDWIDSEESEALLHYQRFDFSAYLRELSSSPGLSRHLVRPLSPFVRRWILANSRPQAMADGRRQRLVEARNFLGLIRRGLSSAAIYFSRH